MKLHIWTQYKENYGAHAWNGKGKCPQYWKFKGGLDYMILNIENINKSVDEIVEKVRPQIEKSSQHWEEYILGWKVVEDLYFTEYEEFQLKYDGHIENPSQILDYE